MNGYWGKAASLNRYCRRPMSAWSVAVICKREGSHSRCWWKMWPNGFMSSRRRCCAPASSPADQGSRLLCYFANRELKMNTVELAEILTISQSAISRSVQRGEKMAENDNLTTKSMECIKYRMSPNLSRTFNSPTALSASFILPLVRPRR